MMPRLLMVSVVVLIASLPLAAEVILDDDFEGTTLDSSIWDIHPWSTGPISVSESRLHLGSGAMLSMHREYPYDGENYVNAYLHSVAMEDMGQQFGLSFGYIGAIGGHIQVTIRANHETILYLEWMTAPYPDPLHTTSGHEIIDLGVSSDGDFEIIWTPTLFQVINNGDVLHSEDDPAKIPYYYAMGPFSLWTWEEGSVSVDPVLLTIPEPATLSVLALGALLNTYCLRRRRK